MSIWEILLLVLIGVVTVGIFVWMLRSDAVRVRRGTAEAEAKGETVKKRPPLGVLYFGVGIAFVVYGAFTLSGH